MRPLISVITPVFNRRNTIGRAVASVLAQDLDSFEHIVIDDGSIDGTSDSLSKITDTRLRVLKLPGWRGANHARNVGLAAAAGEYVTFLDSDDEFLPFRLRKSIETLESNRHTHLLISSFETIRREKRTASVNRDMLLAPEEFERQLFAQTLFIAGSAITLRRNTAADAGGFDEELGRLQDRDFLLRLSRSQRALVRSEIDWIKHQCPDSISSRERGYMGSYADLLGKHPGLAKKYPAIARYMAARHLFSCIIKGRFHIAFEDFRLCRIRKQLGFRLPDLVSGYREGKKQRDAVRSEQRDICASARDVPVEVGTLQIS